MKKSKDSKHICQHCIITGTVVRQTNEGLRINNNYLCEVKNIILNNIACGICNTFRHVESPEVEFSEVIEAS